ncbi:hypothetical protein [Planococcus donghaensis]|uniref:YfjL-like protein n=1 Tax=Planococcus donghaensis TaxID=414778 RepID=UPI0037368BEA
MKKKVIYGGIATLLIAAVVFAYIQMSGNPFEKNRAKESLESFLVQTYPDMDYEIDRSAEYGWTDGTFRFSVVEKEPIGVETTYLIYVSAFEPYEILGDTIHASKIDKAASEKLNEEAQQYILALLQEKVPEIDGVSTDVEVYSNEAAEWAPQLKTPKPILIMMVIEKGDLTNEQILEQSNAIQQQLNGESIDYYLAEVGYQSIVDGEEIYNYVSFAPEQELTIDDVK